MSRVSGQGGSLFERLNPEAPLHRSLQEQHDVAKLIQGIKWQIESLLNTRQGCSQSSPGFGLPDFNDSSSGSADLLIRLTRSIREAIETYEPRVVVRDIRFMPNANAPLELSFRLDCAVAVNSKAELLEIDLVMNGHNRHYRVV